MKMFAVLLFVASASAGRLENNYLPPSSALSASGGSSSLATPFSRLVTSARFAGPTLTPSGLYGAPVASLSTYSRAATPQIPILRLNSENNGDGSYRYEYETANHISAQESGRLVSQDNREVQGSFSYLAPNGETISVSYVANENGFQPSGDHLPTPPPIPAAILRSLEINAAEEARGIVNDGQYRTTSSLATPQYLAPAVNSQYLPPDRQQGGYRY